MTKTKEELNELKAEYNALTAKLQELTEDELIQVTGGYEGGTPTHINGIYERENINPADATPNK